MIRLRFDATGPEQVIGGGRATIKVAPPQDDRKGSSLLYYSVAGTTAGSANFLGRPQGIVPTIQRISPLSPWRRSAGLVCLVLSLHHTLCLRHIVLRSCFVNWLAEPDNMNSRGDDVK